MGIADYGGSDRSFDHREQEPGGLELKGCCKVPRESRYASQATGSQFWPPIAEIAFWLGIISLGGGLPSSDYFPFEHIDVKVPSVGKFSEAETKGSGKVLRIGKHDVPEGKSAYDLAISLNYGQGTGSAQMLRWVTEHTEVQLYPDGGVGFLL